MQDDPWLREFRALHERARRSTLQGEERELYVSARETLARTLTKVQGLTVKPGETARQSFRVALALPVELGSSDGPVRSVTMDVGRGGFSSTLQRLPESKDTVAFTLKLPGGGDPIVGRARVVDYRKQVGNYRASFAFIELSDVEQDRIERALFDSVLARLHG